MSRQTWSGLGVLLGILVLHGSALAAPTFFAGTGHYYDYLDFGDPGNLGMDWYAARDYAHSLSYLGLPGHLVTITSAAENDFIKTTFGRHGWIGAIQTDTVGDYMWGDGPENGTVFWQGGPTGGPVNGMYANFSNGSPNIDAPPGDDAVRMWGLENGDGSSVGQWDNAAHQDTPNFYVEYELLPEPATAFVMLASLPLIMGRCRRYPIRPE